LLLAPMVRGRRCESALPLLHAGVLLVDDVQLAAATHDLAIQRPPLDARFDLHGPAFRALAGGPAGSSSSRKRAAAPRLVPVDDATLAQIIRAQLDGNLIAGQNPDEKLTHLAGHVGQDLVAVLQAYLEHGVREGV